jgi:hypothetical protein
MATQGEGKVFTSLIARGKAGIPPSISGLPGHTEPSLPFSLSAGKAWEGGKGMILRVSYLALDPPGVLGRPMPMWSQKV